MLNLNQYNVIYSFAFMHQKIRPEIIEKFQWLLCVEKSIILPPWRESVELEEDYFPP